ncbi:MAG: hypothetical protein ACKPEQ_30325, partial [Dolichospermum sp.]
MRRALTKLEDFLKFFSVTIQCCGLYRCPPLDPPSASDGLECLIQQMPLNPAQGSSGGQRYKPQHWIVTLKNFKKSSNLVNA